MILTFKQQLLLFCFLVLQSKERTTLDNTVCDHISWKWHIIDVILNKKKKKGKNKK